MKINRKLIKKRFIRMNNINKHVESFSIVITFSHNKVDSLHNCFYYLNKCHDINKCEVILVLYENEYVEYDFSKYENINYRIIHSKRNNDKNIFCISHARNIGLIRAKYDWVLMLDCDILLPEDTCYILSQPDVRNSNNIYFTHRVNLKSNLNIKPNGIYKDIKDLYRYKININKSWIGFFHFYNRKKIIELVGGYDSKMIGWGRDDDDIESRALRLNMKKKSIHLYMKVFHIIHGQDKNWKNDIYLKNNDKIWKNNLNNNILKKENIGMIIK